MTESRHRIAGVWERLRHAWAGSLVLRTVAVTLLASMVVVVIVAWALMQRASSGLLRATEDRSVAEAAAGREQAEQLLAAVESHASTPGGTARLIDAMVGTLARNAGSPPRYEIVLLTAPGTPDDAPQRATNLVSPESVPQRLTEAIEAEGLQSWTPTTVRYLDGTGKPGLAVGAPLQVPGVGGYHLVYLFPYDTEEEVLRLVRQATLVAGALLVALLALMAWLVARQVAVPVRQASRAAVRIAGGDLGQRVPVRGEDEMAQLATSFNTMAVSLQREIRALEHLSQVQQRFVSDVSHELRTPLTTLRLANDVLQQAPGNMDPDTARAAELLATQVDRFEALLGDLLEISRLDAGAAELDLGEEDLGVVVDQVIRQLSGLAEERGCEFRVLSTSVPLAWMDIRRVQRIIRNLLVNALEYGTGHPVEIEVAGDESAVAVSVRDHGPGLSQAEAAHVFDRFWRADPSRARTLGGTGLGLSISAEDARLHGGTLEVTSRPGEGAVFVLTLPTRAGVDVGTSRPIDVVAGGGAHVD